MKERFRYFIADLECAREFKDFWYISLERLVFKDRILLLQWSTKKIIMEILKWR